MTITAVDTPSLTAEAAAVLAAMPGVSYETFLAEAAGERTVVRVYGERSAARGPEAPRVDAAVLGLVRGLLPVPEVLDVRRADPRTGSPGLLVTSYLPGTRLDLLEAREAGARAVESGVEQHVARDRRRSS